MRIVRALAATAAIIFGSVLPLEAATQEDMQKVVKTLSPHPKARGILTRELRLVLTENEPPRTVLFAHYVNPFADDGSMAFSIFIRDGDACGFNMADEDVVGIVIESMRACANGIVSHGTEFFEKHGGAQALFDRLIQAALRSQKE